MSFLSCRAALAVLLLYPFLSAASAPGDTSLGLEQAFELALAADPALRRLPLDRARLQAGEARAAQRPAWVVGVGIENALGTGALRGVEALELTVDVGSTLEPASRRLAREAVARAQTDGLAVGHAAARLDLLAEVARRYLDALALQAEQAVLADLLERREAAAAAAGRRVAAGAEAEPVGLAAQAAVARAGLALARCRVAAAAARRRLGLMWDGEVAGPLAGDLLVLPRTPPFARLESRLAATPALARFAGEARLREARLQLADAQARPALDWRLGVRRLQDSDDWALVGELSMPLGSRRRSQPAVAAARAELELLALERESGERALRATLAEAHGRLEAEALSAGSLDDALIPALERAEAAARRAFEAGAGGYLDWSQLQSELLEARLERIAAARGFHRALVEIQRLTAEPFLALPDTPPETRP